MKAAITKKNREKPGTRLDYASSFWKIVSWWSQVTPQPTKRRVQLALECDLWIYRSTDRIWEGFKCDSGICVRGTMGSGRWHLLSLFDEAAFVLTWQSSAGVLVTGSQGTVLNAFTTPAEALHPHCVTSEITVWPMKSLPKHCILTV